MSSPLTSVVSPLSLFSFPGNAPMLIQFFEKKSLGEKIADTSHFLTQSVSGFIFILDMP